MLKVRIIVGSLLFVIICITFCLDAMHMTSLGLIVLVVVASTLSQHEFYRMAEQHGLRPFKWLGLGAGIMLLSTTHWWGWTDVALLPSWRLGAIFGTLIFACFLAQALRPSLNGTVADIAVTLFGFLYVPFLAASFIGLDHLPNGGAGAVLYVVFTAKSCDIGGYAFGRTIGKRKLSPRISPNKTVAGAVGGMIFSLLVGIPSGMLLANLPLGYALMGSVLLGIASQLGDLCESMIKRDLEAKDASKNLPGFGGVLDLLDCLLLAGPVGYLYFQWLGS